MDKPDMGYLSFGLTVATLGVGLWVLVDTKLLGGLLIVAGCILMLFSLGPVVRSHPSIRRWRSPYRKLVVVKFLRWTEIGGTGYSAGEAAGFPRQISERLVATGAANFYRKRDAWRAAYRARRERRARPPAPMLPEDPPPTTASGQAPPSSRESSG